MQGTAITMRPAQLKGSASGAKTVAAKSPGKKRCVAVAVHRGRRILLIIGCLFVLFVLRNDRLLRTSASATAMALVQVKSPITPVPATASSLPNATGSVSARADRCRH